MSKIRLHGSSSGHTEVAPAAAAGNNTVTLPNSAGTLLLTDGSAASLTQIPAANIVGVATAGLTKSGGGFGKILQVANTTTNGAASVTITSAYANSNIYYITSLNTSLTTTETNSKILISGNIFGEATTYDHVVSFVLSSSINSGTTTPIDTLRGPTYGDRTRVSVMMPVGYYDDDQDSTPSTTTFSNLLYEPAQASGTSITISIGVVVTEGNNNTFYLNRTVNDGNSGGYEKGSSSVTLMEVGA
tara:strand:- start:299 stop:1033 length:735 start_codon:yes stop_codon:yes gene_type:complete